MRKQNLIIFSAGESLRSGRIHYIKNQLEKSGLISCTIYNELFDKARDKNHIALLPALIKKIPSFDFALIVAEGVDETYLRQTETIKSMRDNVVFEIGLCVMGLGAKRVILLSEQELHLPDDLIDKQGIGIYHIEFQKPDIDSQLIEIERVVLEESLKQNMDDILSYISVNSQTISPVFIGASISLAESYFNNFLLRLVEYLDAPVYQSSSGQAITFDDLKINIYLPNVLEQNIKTKIKSYYQREGLEDFYISDAGTRSLYFKGKLTGSSLQIVDIPTSVTASYAVVHTILNIDSDEAEDSHAKERFIVKEMDMFKYALTKFMTADFLDERLAYVEDVSKKARMKDMFSKICLLQKDIN